MKENEIYELKSGSPASVQGQPQFLMIDEIVTNGSIAWVVFSNDCANWRPHSLDRGVAWIKENYELCSGHPSPPPNRLESIT
jgi:hypothetical protein